MYRLANLVSHAYEVDAYHIRLVSQEGKVVAEANRAYNTTGEYLRNWYWTVDYDWLTLQEVEDILATSAKRIVLLLRVPS